MHEGYLLIEKINVSDCNLETSHLTCSFPLTAAAGFSSVNLKRGLEHYFEDRGAEEEYELRGFGVCLHEYQVYRGITKNPLALCKGAGGKQAEDDLLNPPMIPEIKGRLTFSLIIKIGYEEQPPELDGDFQKDFVDHLLSLRFAGGDVIAFKRVYGKQHYLQALRFFNNQAELADYFIKVAPGWFIKDRSDLIEQGGEDKLKTLLETVAFPRSNTEATPFKRKPGWLYAACVGYQLLEEPVERPGRRDESVLHAYAEPVHSLCELVHANRLLRSSITGNDLSAWLSDNHLIWSWQFDADARLSRLAARNI